MGATGSLEQIDGTEAKETRSPQLHLISGTKVPDLPPPWWCRRVPAAWGDGVAEVIGGTGKEAWSKGASGAGKEVGSENAACEEEVRSEAG